jgi:acetoin utilization protein AcuC
MVTMGSQVNQINKVCVYIGEELGRYGFGHGHPFHPHRMDVFWSAAQEQGLDKKVNVCQPVLADRATIELFHTHDYVDRVIAQSKLGEGYLDYGDTPAFPGVYEAAACVVGSTLDALDRQINGQCKRAFVPIAGLHHARRDAAAGFCVFNDCGVAIETLREKYNVQRVAYVDIDAHHGDGVYYGFEDDPLLIIADLHEDGHCLYPGTGAVTETGKGPAAGTKLNIPMPPGADDAAFEKIWPKVEEFVIQGEPEIILLQCGVDSLASDPITHLMYTQKTHHYAAERLCAVADKHCNGRILAMGGGGYNNENIAEAWTAVVRAFIES